MPRTADVSASGSRVNFAENLHAFGFRRFDHAMALAVWAGAKAHVPQWTAEPLTGKLHDTKAGYGGSLYAGLVRLDCSPKFPLYGGLVFPVSHVDKIDDDKPAQVAQPELACGFSGRLKVGLIGCFLHPLFG